MSTTPTASFDCSPTGGGRGVGAAAWGARSSAGTATRPRSRTRSPSVNEAMAAVLDPITDRVLLQLSALVADEIAEAAEARRAEGGLEFHDLLVLARNLLRTDVQARRSLHERYPHLLLDEFQDTDPIQIELAVLIATDAPDVVDRSWFDLPVAAGRLFFVGDPKQSIYRFRRADISLFLRARDRFAGPAGAHQLTTNFRTVEPIVEWVNATFSTLMPEELPARQPRYESLAADRTSRHGPDRHLPILLGGPHPDPKVTSAELREAEAVRRGPRGAGHPRQPRPVPRSSVAPGPTLGCGAPPSSATSRFLLPTRTSLPFLKAALEHAGIRYRIATGTLVYDTQEVVDALAALRAIDDPSDELSLVAALRSPLYGCSDVDLFTWKHAGGHWDHRRAAPPGVDADHPVARAHEHLRGLWGERWFLTPSGLLERLRARTPGHDVGLRHIPPDRRLATASLPRRTGSCLRGVVSRRSAGIRRLGRAAVGLDGPGCTSRCFPRPTRPRWASRRFTAPRALEFPITILSGMTTQMHRRHNGVSVLWGDVGTPEIRMRSGVTTMRHEPRADLESEMDDHEKLRLAYVATTRARDHLIVSCHHKQGQAAKTYGGMFHEVFDDPKHEHLARRPDLDAWIDDTPPEPPRPAQLGLALDARNRWIERRAELLGRFTEPRVLSATGVAKAARGDDQLVDEDDDGADRPDEGVVPDRRRGRTGSAIGSAVHGVLHLLDLDAPDDLDSLIDQQSHAEAVPQHSFVVGQLVRAALASDAVQLATRHRHHKELFVAAPVEDRIVEGYVDLLVEGPDGLIVVDYKTDAVRTDADIDAKLESYELQAAAYAVALEQATGIDVVECRFVFLRTAGAVERTVADLPAAMARVRSTVGAGTH